MKFVLTLIIVFAFTTTILVKKSSNLFSNVKGKASFDYLRGLQNNISSYEDIRALNEEENSHIAQLVDETKSELEYHMMKVVKESKNSLMKQMEEIDQKMIIHLKDVLETAFGSSTKGDIETIIKRIQNAAVMSFEEDEFVKIDSAGEKVINDMKVNLGELMRKKMKRNKSLTDVIIDINEEFRNDVSIKLGKINEKIMETLEKDVKHVMKEVIEYLLFDIPTSTDHISNAFEEIEKFKLKD